MKIFSKIISATALSILSALFYSSAAIADSPPDISGTYNCNGTNPVFSETLVFKKNGDVFNIKITHSGDTLPHDYATAIFNPSNNNVFGLVYWDVKDSTSFGNEIFFIKPDGSLDGLYLDPDKTEPSPEVCTKS